jgi:hypothetical protein
VTLYVPGGIIFIVAFVGCCGACQESRCLVYTYAFLLAVILVAQVSSFCFELLLSAAKLVATDAT